jgi:hypothetical protein
MDILPMALACPVNISDRKDVSFSLSKVKINRITERKRRGKKVFILPLIILLEIILGLLSISIWNF